MDSHIVARRPMLRWSALRQRVGWIDHLARTFGRYIAHRGYQQAAAVTYFSLLSVVPLLMVVLSVAGYVLAGHPGVLGQLRGDIQTAVPTPSRPLVTGLIDSIVDHRFSLGIIGVLIAAYSGWNWMNALRDALTGMWRLQRADERVVTTVAKDLLALAGLGLALLVMFSLTVAGDALLGAMPGIVHAIGWHDTTLAGPVRAVLSLLATVIFDWLVFWWILTTVPRVPVRPREARWPALATAIGFELLKYAGTLYLRALGSSPTGVAFGSIVGVLVFAYLIARLILLAAAWIATGSDV